MDHINNRILDNIFLHEFISEGDDCYLPDTLLIELCTATDIILSKWDNCKFRKFLEKLNNNEKCQFVFEIRNPVNSINIWIYKDNNITVQLWMDGGLYDNITFTLNDKLRKRLEEICEIIKIHPYNPPEKLCLR